MTPRHTLLLITACTASACAPQRDAELANSTRLVFTPSSIAELTPASESAALPAEITFGSSHGRSALYLQFPADFAGYGAQLKAYLTLSPRAAASTDASPVVVEAWRVNATWRAAELSAWSDKPPLAPPYASQEISGSPAHELRIDVTPLVRFAAQNPTRNFGLAVIGRGGTGHGASFATGISGGTAPRLEVYVR